MDIVLVPAYNEQKTIRELLSRLKKMTKFETIVVDDGSVDSTVDIVKKMRVTLVRHSRNKGKAEATKTGFRYILQNYPSVKHVVLLDADMQYYPEDAPKLVEPLKKGEADFVTGFRSWSTVPFRHNLGNFVWRLTFNLIFGTNFKDTNCGYMALTRKSMQIMSRILYGGYTLENAMFIEAIKSKLRIMQVPVRVIYKEQRDVVSGVRVVSGLLLFIIKNGLKYRFGIR